MVVLQLLLLSHVVIFAFHNHGQMLTDSEVIFLLASFGECLLWQCLKADFGGPAVHRRI